METEQKGPRQPCREIRHLVGLFDMHVYKDACLCFGKERQFFVSISLYSNIQSPRPVVGHVLRSYHLAQMEVLDVLIFVFVTNVVVCVRELT